MKNSLHQYRRRRGLLCTLGRRSQDCGSPTRLKGNIYHTVFIDPKTVDLEHCRGKNKLTKLSGVYDPETVDHDSSAQIRYMKFSSSQIEEGSHTTALRVKKVVISFLTTRGYQLHTTVPKYTSKRNVYPLHNLVPRYDVHAGSNSLHQHWRQRGSFCTLGQRSQDCGSPTYLKRRYSPGCVDRSQDCGSRTQSCIELACNFQNEIPEDTLVSVSCPKRYSSICGFPK